MQSKPKTVTAANRRTTVRKSLISAVIVGILGGGVVVLAPGAAQATEADCFRRYQLHRKVVTEAFARTQYDACLRANL